ncbi:MAG: beta,6-galactofuranosyltransferase [Ramlibacter sp.]|nr:beta,6-galactofuranosyltransferase [Ramlibacter sp.]
MTVLQKADKVLLTTLVPNQKTAWTKARVDVSHIMERGGYTSMYLPEAKSPGRLLMFALSLKKRISERGHIVIEYPFDHRKRAYLLYLFSRLTKIKIYALIHDLNSLRFSNPQDKELAILNLFDGVISHNPSMTTWLAEKGFSRKLVDLGVFDYCNDQTATYHEQRMSNPVKVVYAGNLSYTKATYIYDREFNSLKNVEISAYGQFFEQQRLESSAIAYKGVFDPDRPVLDGKYHFGLVWEGTSMETCNGEYGRYLRFNNPHKLSLYIALGLPVIIWEHAAAARFVREQNIGITIGTLRDLQEVHSRVSDADYETMARNAERLSLKVKRGDYLNRALARLVN